VINHTKAIHQWSAKAGLLKDNRYNESAMLLEEVLEGIGVQRPKERAHSLMEQFSVEGVNPVPDRDWLDHLCDIEFILHGSKCKMGLSPQQDNKSLGFVLEANNKKIGAGTDSNGKLQKPDDWDKVLIELDARLDKLLSEC